MDANVLDKDGHLKTAETLKKDGMYGMNAEIESIYEEIRDQCNTALDKKYRSERLERERKKKAEENKKKVEESESEQKKDSIEEDMQLSVDQIQKDQQINADDEEENAEPPKKRSRANDGGPIAR